MAGYLQDVADHSPSRDFLVYTSQAVLTWWGAKRLDEVNAGNCRAFVEWRCSQRVRRSKTPRLVTDQTARHELKTLRTAINYYHREHGPLAAVPKVTLPQRSPQRIDYWLTRKDVAARIKAARSDPLSHHVARLLLIGVYSGTRPGAILGLKWLPSTTDGWFDLERGVLHRKGLKARRSKKRAPPARIHERLLPHLLRWSKADLAAGVTSVVHYQGQPIRKLRRSWATVARRAGATRKDGPHIVRHTAATWQMQAGTDLFEAAGYLGMSPETLWATYGHHHPDFQATAARAIPRKLPRNA
jgi:integrase